MTDYRIYTDELEKIFDKYSKSEGLVGEIAKRGYAFSLPEQKNILFIGINPSYVTGAKPDRFCYKPHDAVKGYAKHFAKFQEIANMSKVESDWGYIDLFYFRETEQARIHKIIKSPNGLHFICDQLKLTIKILEKFTPKILVVCNSLAGTFLGLDSEFDDKKKRFLNVWIGYEFKFNEFHGTDIISGLHHESLNPLKTTKLQGVPALFTSTLTYMSKKNKERIAWQIRQILKYDFITTDNHRNSSTLKSKIQELIALSNRTKELKQLFLNSESYELSSELRNKELGYYERILEILNKSIK